MLENILKKGFYSIVVTVACLSDNCLAMESDNGIQENAAAGVSRPASPYKDLSKDDFRAMYTKVHADYNKVILDKKPSQLLAHGTSLGDAKKLLTKMCEDLHFELSSRKSTPVESPVASPRNYGPLGHSLSSEHERQIKTRD